MDNPKGGQIWVVEVNKMVVGSIAITRSTSETAQLRWFILDNAYQGLGLGKKLMNQALNFCNENSYKHVFLWTVDILGAARHLYEKFGFQLTEQKQNNTWNEQQLIEEKWELNID